MPMANQRFPVRQGLKHMVLPSMKTMMMPNLFSPAFKRWPAAKRIENNTADVQKTPNSTAQLSANYVRRPGVYAIWWKGDGFQNPSVEVKNNRISGEQHSSINWVAYLHHTA